LPDRPTLSTSIQPGDLNLPIRDLAIADKAGTPKPKYDGQLGADNPSGSPFTSPNWVTGSPFTSPNWVTGDLALEPLPTPLSIYSYQFNGIDEYVGGYVNTALNLNLLTIEAWITISATNKLHPLVCLAKINNKQTTTQYKLWIDDKNHLKFSGLFPNSSTPDSFDFKQFTDDRPIQLNQPTHVAVVVKGNDVKLYVNARSRFRRSLMGAVTTDNAITLDVKDSSILYFGHDFESNYLQGTLQELRIWGTTKLQEQLQDTRYHQLAGSEPDLVGYWRLDEPDPSKINIVQDRSFQKHQLFPGGIPELYQPKQITHPEVIVADPVQSAAQALTFNKNQYPIVIANQKRQGLGYPEQFTLQFWFKPQAPIDPSEKQILFSQGDEDTGLSIYLFEGKLHAYAWIADFGGKPIKNRVHLEHSSIEGDSWQHFTFTYDETVEKELFLLDQEKLSANWLDVFKQLDQENLSAMEQDEKGEELLASWYSIFQDNGVVLSTVDGKKAKSVKIFIDVRGTQWRIKDYILNKTYVIHFGDQQFTIYEKTTTPNEIAYRLYIDGELAEEQKSDLGIRLDQVGEAYLGGLLPEKPFTRFHTDDRTNPPSVLSDSYPFHGQITDFQLWHIAIPNEKITSPASKQHPRHITPDLDDKNLACYLPIAEGYGRSVSDHQGPFFITENCGLGPEVPDQSPHLYHAQLSVGPDTPDWAETNDLPIFRNTVLKLNGKNEYLRLPYAVDLKLLPSSHDSLQDFTLETWIRYECLGTEMPIIGSDRPHHAHPHPHQDFSLALTATGQVKASFGEDDIITTISLESKKWHHIAWRFEQQPQDAPILKIIFWWRWYRAIMKAPCFNQSQLTGWLISLTYHLIYLEYGRGKQTIWIDGVVDASREFCFGLHKDIPLYLGYRREEDDCKQISKSYFHGEVSELRFWNNARSNQDICNHYNKILSGQEEHLQAYWVFDQDPRYLLVDRSPAAHPAPIVITSPCGIDPKWVETKTAFRSEYLALNLNPDLSKPIDYIALSPYQVTDIGTLELWVKFCRDRDQVLFDASGVDGNSQFVVDVECGKLRFLVSIAEGETLGAHLIAQIDLRKIRADFDTQFQHIAATWHFDRQHHTTSIHLFLNGIDKSRTKMHQCLMFSDFRSPFVGLPRDIERINYPEEVRAARPLQGQISQLRLWDVILPLTELDRLRHADLKGTEAGLQVYLPFTDDKATAFKNMVVGCGLIKSVHLMRIPVQAEHPHWVSVDKSIALDGNNDFINVSHYQPTEAGTIEVWAKFSRDRNQIIWDASNDEPSGTPLKQKFFLLAVHEQKLRFGLEDKQDFDFLVEIDLSGDKYENFHTQRHHIAVTWKYDPCDKTVVAQLFLDGEGIEVLDCEEPENRPRHFLSRWLVPGLSGVKPVFKSLLVGKCRGYYPWEVELGTAALPFAGEISQVRIWNRVRTMEELQVFRDACLTGNEYSLSVYLPIEEGHGTILNNLVNPHQPALLVVGCEDEQVRHKWVDVDNALDLDGVDTFIDIPHYIPTQKGSIEFWGKFSRCRDQVLFDASDDRGNVFILEVVANEYLRLGFNDDSRDGVSLNLSELPNFNSAWHYIVATWHYDPHSHNLTANLYLDGLYQATFCSQTEWHYDCLRNLHVGIRRGYRESVWDYQAFQGQISQICVWNCVLPQADFDLSHLLIDLPIDEGEGSILRDSVRDSHGLVKRGVVAKPKWIETCTPMFQFDRDFAALPQTKVLDITCKSFTIEALINIQDFAAELPILGIREPRNPHALEEEQFVLSVNQHRQLQLRIHELRIHDKLLVNNKIELKPHIWYHVICRYDSCDRNLSVWVLKWPHADARSVDADGEMKQIFSIYLDGWLRDQDFADIDSYQANRRLYIGHWRNWSEESHQWDVKSFRGFIDEVRIWNEVRTESEIRKHREIRLQGNEPHLAGYWRMTGEYLRTLFSLNDQHSPIWIPGHVSADLFAPIYSPNRADYPPIFKTRHVPDLDGQNDYIQLGNTFLRQQPHTIEFWIQDPKKVWHHIALLYHNNHQLGQIFVNGAPIASNQAQQVSWLTQIVKENEDHPNRFFKGYVAEVRLWVTLLTPEFIQNNRFRIPKPWETHLWAYWKLDEGSGQILHDYSETLAPAKLDAGLEKQADKWERETPPPIYDAVSVLPSQGKAISALYLDGKDDHLVLSKVVPLGSGQSFTVEAWVKIKSKETRMPLLGDKRQHGVAPTVFSLGIDNGHPYLVFDAKNEITSKFTLTENWHHIIWQYSAPLFHEHTLSILVDGVQVEEQKVTIPLTEQHCAFIGKGYRSNHERKADYFAGGIGEIRIWNSARTSAQIRQYQNHRLPGNAETLSELLAYWIFDDRNRVVIPSKVPNPIEVDDNSYEMVMESDMCHHQPVWNHISNHPIQLNPLSQDAFKFDGKFKYLATDEFEFPESFTMEAWVKVDDVERSRPIFWWGKTRQESNFDLRIVNTQGEYKVEFSIQNNNAVTSHPIVLRENDDAIFVHIAVVVDQMPRGTTTVTLFINGEAQPSGTTSESIPLTDRILQIGRGDMVGDSPEYFKGLIQEVRIWKGAKSSEFLQSSRYHSQLLDQLVAANPNALIPQDLVAYWPLSASSLVNNLDTSQPDQYQVEHSRQRITVVFWYRWQNVLAKVKEGGKAKTEKELQQLRIKFDLWSISLGYWLISRSSNKPALRLGGLNISRKPSTGEPREFVDARRKLLTPLLVLEDPEQWWVPSFGGQEYEHRAQRTIEVWFQSENPFLADRQVLYQEGDDQRGLSIYIQKGKLHFTGHNKPIKESSWQGSTISIDRIQPGYWHHAALVLDGRAEIHDNAFTALLDGRVIDTKPGSQIWGKSSKIWIAGLGLVPPKHKSKVSITPDRQYLLHGQIKEIRVWQSSRTIQEIYTNRFALPADAASRSGLLFLWETEQKQIEDGHWSLPNDVVSAMKVSKPMEKTASDPTIPMIDLAHLLRLHHEYQQPVKKLCSLFTEIQHIGKGDQRTLFDDIFNPSDIPTDRRWSSTQLLRWEVQPGPNKSSQNEIRSRLMKSLRVRSSADLDLMVKIISGDVSNLILDSSYLAQLYRLKQLATLLKLSIKDLTGLIKLLREEYQGTGLALNSLQDFSVQDVYKLKERADWMRESKIDLSEYNFLVYDKDNESIGGKRLLPYSTDSVVGMATSLLTKARTHLLQPLELETEGISSIAAKEVYSRLQENDFVDEIEFPSQLGNDNPESIIKLGAVKNDFSSFSLRKNWIDYLTEIASKSDWQAEFKNLAISEQILKRKGYRLFSFSQEQPPSEKDKVEWVKKIDDQGYQINEEELSISTSEWLLSSETVFSKYLIEKNQQQYQFSTINDKQLFEIIDLDGKIIDSLQNMRVSDEVKNKFKNNNAAYSLSDSLQADEWVIISQNSTQDLKQIFLLKKVNDQLKVYDETNKQANRPLFRVTNSGQITNELNRNLIPAVLRTEFDHIGSPLAKASSISKKRWILKGSVQKRPLTFIFKLNATAEKNIVIYEASANGRSLLFNLNLDFAPALDNKQIPDELKLLFELYKL
jgi:Concanavalin A-like lectin/glucanases superfamily